MIITQEWIETLKDEKGMTLGQEMLLNKWVGVEWEGKEISEQVANFLEHCKGYRCLPARIRAFKGWT